MADIAGIFLFLLIFVGDGKVHDIDLFFLFYSFSILLVLSQRNVWKISFDLGVLIFLLIASIPISMMNGFGDFHWLWSVKALLLLVYVLSIKDFSFKNCFSGFFLYLSLR